MNKPAQLSFREVLQLPAVRRLWLAQSVSVFGDFLAMFAALSVVSFKLHGTATQITLITVSFMIPFAFVGPLAVQLDALIEQRGIRRDDDGLRIVP